MRTFKVLWIFLLFTLIVYVNPAINSNENTIHSINRNQLEENFIRKLNTKCIQRDNHSCIMLKLIVQINRIFQKPTTTINENLRLEQNRALELVDDPEDDVLLSRAINSDSETLGIILAEKLWKFVRTRTAKYKLYENADILLNLEPLGKLNFGISISPLKMFEEGRGKMKHIGHILTAVAMKIGFIGALLIKGLILLTGKALLVSKIALILAVVIGVKRLLSKNHVTYEVVAHPHHETSHTHIHDSYSPGWATRALDGFVNGLADLPAKLLDAQVMAFAGQKPQKE